MGGGVPYVSELMQLTPPLFSPVKLFHVLNPVDKGTISIPTVQVYFQGKC